MSEILIYCINCSRYNDLEEIKDGKCYVCEKQFQKPYHIKFIGSLRKKEDEFWKCQFSKLEKDCEHSEETGTQ